MTPIIYERLTKLFSLYKKPESYISITVYCTLPPILKATPHNYRPSGFVGACLQIFRHLAQILLEIRWYSCVEFIQSAGKFADAITQQ